MRSNRPATEQSTAASGSGGFQAFKETWLKAVASHSNLSGATYAVAIMIATYVNSRNRLAWPSIETLAGDTNRSPSTVWRAIRQLEEYELLEINRSQGRGRSHRYSLKLGSMDRDPRTLRRRKKRHCEFATPILQTRSENLRGVVDEPQSQLSEEGAIENESRSNQSRSARRQPPRPDRCRAIDDVP